MKVLNLYAGIGGNRKRWKNVEVTAVENNPKIAKTYQDLFLKDKVIICDAHQYLLDHYKEFDFIWSSPPCPSHSDIRRLFVDIGQNKAIYPDMKLYEEIIFLKHFFKGKWVVENVVSYYDPLIKPYRVGRHYIWSNFYVPNRKYKSSIIIQDTHDKTIRNMVNPKVGLHVFNCAFRIKQMKLE